MNIKRASILLLVIAAIASFFVFDLGRFFDLTYLKSQQQTLVQVWETRPLYAAGVYLVVYIISTALSFPGASTLTLLGGAIFGFVWGTVLTSIASSIGATLAMLGARYLFRDAVRSKFGNRLAAMDEGVEREGSFYLFTLRLVPIFPFFAVNLLMGLTKIPVRTYFWVSQLGMLAGTAVYVNAGTQLAQITSTKGILSPALLGSFVLLGFFPLLAKRVVGMIQARQVYKGWAKPSSFDRNVVVIGAGAAGLVTSYIAAAVKAKVTLVENHKMGGDCLNYGCVPSKALIRSAKLVKQIKHSATYGIAKAQADFDFADVMERVSRVVKTVEPHDSIERYTDLGVDVVQGTATITSPWTVEIKTASGVQTLTTKNIVIATGARPFVPPIPGLDTVTYYTSDTLWELRVKPQRMVVLGGGPIGCELAQSFARLGIEVSLVEMAPRIMIREDDEVSRLVAGSMSHDGVQLLTGHKALRCEKDGHTQRLVVSANGQEKAIEFDALLCAVGRVARVEGFGLEALGISVTARKTVDVNGFLQTKYPNIYACGDVAGPYQFTHTAAHQAWYAAVNALFGRFKQFAADYRVIPWTTFTDPEVARVGLSESEAKDKGIPVEITHYGMDDLDRAIADDTAYGFVKVLTVPGKDTILGATIVGEHAGDLLAEFVLAMKHGLGLNKILGTIHTYPTLAEANKYAAGEWKRAHAPQGLLKWVEKYHAWERG